MFYSAIQKFWYTYSLLPSQPYESWFAGTEAGNAISDLLFGDYAPTGKLPITFPRSVGQIPIFYNHLMGGRPALDPLQKYESKYLDIPNDPLYPFGFGLTYTSFSYSNLTLSSKTFANKSQVLTVSSVVTNNGAKDGTEIVQFYFRDVVASVARPVIELKDF